MTKKILVLYYSQSGQLTDILNNFIQPFTSSDFLVDIVSIKPEKEFEFPWTGKRFFEAMPESVLGIPVALKPFEFKETQYDLVVFGYQPWFLSPSIPATSILTHSKIQTVLKNTPIITVIGSRNMWLNSQEKVKKLIQNTEGKLVGNIVLSDKHNNQVSAVTIMYWMFTGKKDRFKGIFPKPGVSDNDIKSVNRFSPLVKNAVLNNDFNSLQQKLVEHNAVEIKTDLMFIENRAGKLFDVWARIIIKRKNRKLWLTLFKIELVIGLFLIAPLVVSIYMIIFSPLLISKINRKKQYYLGLSQ